MTPRDSAPIRLSGDADFDFELKTVIGERRR